MASALLRRAAVPVALAALTLGGMPLLTGPAAAASPPPSFVPASSTPAPNGAVIVGNETLTIAFDQGVTGDPKTAVQVYERNADGSRGFPITGGTTSFGSCNPVQGPSKTVTWTPNRTLVALEYEVVAHVTAMNSDCTADKTRTGSADYDYFVAGGVTPAKPTNLSSVPINNQNDTAAPFSGIAPPDLTVKVTVSGNDADTGQVPTTASGSARVPVCGEARCPFTVKVDVSGLDDGKLAWSAQGTESESSSKTDVATAPADAQPTKDTTAPSRPTLSAGPSYDKTADAVHVPQATSNSDATKFIITISDPDGHSTTQTVDAQTTMPAQDVPVSTLDDGTLKVLVQAEDSFGNVSSPSQSDQLGDPYTVTKNAGLLPNLGASTLTTPAGDVTFVQAESHGVQTPTSIDVEFTQPVKLSYNNPNNGTAGNPQGTQNASLQLTSPNGNSFLSVTPALSSSGRGVTATIPADQMPATGSFGVSVTVFSKNLCPDVNPGATDSCQKFTGLVRVGTGNTGDPFLVTLDNQPPTITFTRADNIDATNLQTAGLAGTVDSDVSAVQVTFTSSNAPGHPRVASLPTSTSNGTTTFSSSPLPLSGMVDGTLTIDAKAVDAAGNAATKSTQVTLNALGLTLVPGDGKILVTWTKPALVNGEAPTYTLTYRDQSVENAAVQTVSPAPSSTATSQLLTGLVDGHDYGITLTATDSVGDGPVAVGDTVPKGNPTLTLSAPSKSPYGVYFTLGGHLRDNGTGVAGKPVDVAMYYGSKKVTTFHAKTDSTGGFGIRVRPLHTVTYVATFAGDAGYGATSAKKRVAISANIRISHVTWSSKSHTTPVHITGHVAPNMRGQAVFLYEIVKHHAHRLAQATVNRKSDFAFSRVFSAGKHVVFVRIYGHNGYYGANSKTRSFSRT